MIFRILKFDLFHMLEFVRKTIDFKYILRHQIIPLFLFIVTHRRIANCLNDWLLNFLWAFDLKGLSWEFYSAQKKPRSLCSDNPPFSPLGSQGQKWH